MDKLESTWKLFLDMIGRAGVSVQLFLLTLLFGLTLGLIVAVGRMSKKFFIREPIKLYLLVMRGTPLLLQLYVVFYFPPLLLFPFLERIGIVVDWKMDRFVAATVAFALNYAAYFAEIYRAGIESIPKGQREAAAVLGFSKKQTFFKIILPQVVKRILPPMSNEFMTLVKDTSLASVIAIQEIYQLATGKMSSSGSFTPILMAGVFYLAMNAVVGKGFSIAEKKLDYYR